MDTATQAVAGQERQTGLVRFFDEKKGWGFITPNDGGPDLFAHYSEIDTEGFKTLLNGQAVSFEVENAHKGLKAKNIKPLD